MRNMPHSAISNEVFKLRGVKDWDTLEKERRCMELELDEKKQEKHIRSNKFKIDIEVLDFSTAEDKTMNSMNK
jgi:hypothetical protein